MCNSLLIKTKLFKLQLFAYLKIKTFTHCTRILWMRKFQWCFQTFANRQSNSKKTSETKLTTCILQTSPKNRNFHPLLSRCSFFAHWAKINQFLKGSYSLFSYLSGKITHKSYTFFTIQKLAHQLRKKRKVGEFLYSRCEARFEKGEVVLTDG